MEMLKLWHNKQLSRRWSDRNKKEMRESGKMTTPLIRFGDIAVYPNNKGQRLLFPTMNMLESAVDLYTSNT